MDRSEILLQIKKAEQEAKYNVQKAIEDKNNRIAEAKKEARNIIKMAEENAHKYADDLLKKAEQEIKQERQSIIDKGLEEAKSLKNKAKLKIDQAVDYLIKEFERTIHAEA
ncbi:MAG: ATP synthase archaeal subunit H [Methanosarcinales archaeon]